MSRVSLGKTRQLGGSLSITGVSSRYPIAPSTASFAPVSSQRSPSGCSNVKLELQHASRGLHTTTPAMASADAALARKGEKKKDWSATQYLKFNDERTQPVRDLVSRIRPLVGTSTPRIFDLGCGPGNSTAVLQETWPEARITGIDNSPDMLQKARARFGIGQGQGKEEEAIGSVDFRAGDLTDIATSSGSSEEYSNIDVVFSNAAFHWLHSPTRLNTIRDTFATLAPGGVLALQVPDNYDAPTHSLMRLTALLKKRAWSPYFANAKVGIAEDKDRPDLDGIEPPANWHTALAPLAAAGGLHVWRTSYYHLLDDAHAIVEWVKGTGLQPFLHRMGDDEEAKGAYLEEYERRLASRYKPLDVDKKIIMGYRRLFLVGVRG